jgi:hypothetical protein
MRPSLHRPARQCAVPAILAALLLAGPGTAIAADPAPSPNPLWQAYPLDIGGGTSRKPPPATPESTTPAPSVRVDPPSAHGAPLEEEILLYAGIAGIVACAGVAVRRQLRRRRASQPVTCEIAWSPDERGPAFTAILFGAGETPRLVAESRRFTRQASTLPAENATTHDAYAELVEHLVSVGSEPYEHGPHWWDLSLRPVGSARPPKEVLHA